MRILNIVILVIVLLSCSAKRNRLTILFDNVEGLKEGSNVYFKGLVVGEVRKLSLATSGVLADINLIDTLQIPSHSRFIISPSLISGSHITIEPSESTTHLSEEDTVLGYFQEKRIYDDWTSDTLKQKRIRASIEKIGEGFKELFEAAKKDSSEAPK